MYTMLQYLSTVDAEIMTESENNDGIQYLESNQVGMDRNRLPWLSEILVRKNSTL